MRTTTRLCLVASIAAAVSLSAVPVGHAAKQPGSVNIKGVSSGHNDEHQNKQINQAQRRANRAHRRIRRLKQWNFTLQDWNKNQQSAIESLQNTVATIVAGVPTITSALTQLQAGLVALRDALEGPVADAFEDIEDALNDSTTGLVGLNLARPQFGAFNTVGTFQGGTGPVNGTDPPHGPDGDVAGRSGSVYVVDFNNDVSQRMYTVNVFPGTVPANPALPGGAVNCALAAATCNAIAAGTGDTSHVLVKVGSGAQAVDGTAFGGFSVTALSG